MDQIRDLKGNSIIMDPIKNPEMFGMDKPALVVTLQDKDGDDVGQLRLSKIDVKKAASRGRSNRLHRRARRPSTTRPRARAARYFRPTIFSSAS